MNTRVPLAALTLALASATLPAQERTDELQPTVGMRARIWQRVLPGTALRAKPIEDPMSPIVLRVLDTWPHGDAFRYDLEYVGMEPGVFDLVAFMERVDGSPLGELPRVEVDVQPVLPDDRVEPNALRPGELPEVGGYRGTLILLGVLWGCGLVAILFVGRRRRGADDGDAAAARPVTLADRLRPRVEAAMAGTLDERGRAELERLLLSHWRDRLGLRERTAADAIAALRAHPDAGALLRQLELWLHAPADAREPIDVNALLEPYRRVAAEDAT